MEKIESYFSTSTYQETVSVSANFNSRLSNERRLRLPFLDPQTGVAQRHSALYMKPKHRMPGHQTGQIYTYPAKRWRKSKRQYLTNMMTNVVLHQQTSSSNNFPASALMGSSSFGGGASSNHLHHHLFGSTATAGITSGGSLVSQFDENSNSNTSLLLEKSLGDAALDGDTNSRDTNNNSKEELSKDWLYDDMDNDFDTFSEPKSPPDDEYDYDPNPKYGNKKKAKKAPKKEAKVKKSAASNFDFNGGHATSGTGKRGRAAKDTNGTTPKKAAVEGGSDRGKRRKAKEANGNATGPKKKFEEPPSFESAAAAIDDQGSFGSTTNGFENGDLRTYRPYL